MRNSSRSAWLVPMVLAGCTNNNIFVTGTVSDTATGATGSATDTSSGDGGETSSSGAETTETSGTETTGDTSSGSGDETSTGDASSGDASSGDASSGDASSGDASGGGETTDGESSGTTAEGPACGDGVLDGDEACDDGDQIPGDGCDAECAIEAPRWAVAGNQPKWMSQFKLYDLEAGWTEYSVNIPNYANSGLTGAISAEHVIVLGETSNTLYRYSLVTKTWSTWAPGPPAIPNIGGFMEWVGDGVCLAYLTVKELHCFDGEGWRLIPLTIPPGSAAAWDPQTNELYIKLYKQYGYQVVDLDTDTIARTSADALLTVENAFATHRAGEFVMADNVGVWALDDQGAGKAYMSIPTQSSKIAGAFHPLTGKLYIVGDDPLSAKNTLQEYDPTTGVTVTVPTTWSSGGWQDPTLRFQRPRYEPLAP